MKVVYDMETDGNMCVYVYYVHTSVSCMCVWLLCYVFVCMISWMIRPPCEITVQLAAHKTAFQHCFTCLILTLKQATKMHHCRTKKNSGEGHSPLLILPPHWRGDTPPETRRHSVPRFSCLRRSARRSHSFSSTTQTLLWTGCKLTLSINDRQTCWLQYFAPLLEAK